MVAIPSNAVTMEDLGEWSALRDQLAAIKAKEMLLRTKIYGGMFAVPVEGTNTVALAMGWQLKAVRVVNRKVDLPVLQAMATVGGALHTVNLRADDLINWKPEVNMTAYRQLTAEQRAVFDQCLEIKDGSPAVTLVAPKE